MARRGFTGTLMNAAGTREHTASVTDKTEITPAFLRVHLHSDSLFDDVEIAPTAWLRFWFPDHTGRDFEHQRGYTISSGDAASGDFTVDFVLHEPAGPASSWAQRCTPGDSIAVTTLGSSTFEAPEEPPAGYLLCGDAAAIPAIAGLISAIPATTPIELYLEEHGPFDRKIPLPTHPRMRLHWVPRHGPESLAAAIEPRDWSNWYVWATPESASLKHLRARLKNEFGFPRSETHAQAYWVEGRAMGKQRGEEAPAGASQAPVSPDSPVASATPDTSDVHEPKARPASSTTTAPPPGSRSTAAGRGKWRAAAGSRLLAPLKPQFIIAGVLQTLVTLLELAPFFLLVELARRFLSGDTAGLWPIGIWALALLAAGTALSAALTFWLHFVDARFTQGARRRLLAQLAALPLGWFDARGSSRVKQVVRDDTQALHYLITHAVSDAVAAVVAPVAVLVYLFIADWRLALIMLVPVLVYIVAMYLMVLRSYDATPKSQKWAERMGAEAGAYLEAQPVVRVFGGAAASTFRARLREYVGFLEAWQRPFTGLKTFMDLATRPATFLLLICVFGTLWIAGGVMDPFSLLPFLLLGTTFGSRLLGIGYGLSGLRDGLLAAQRVQGVLEAPRLTEHAGQPATPRLPGPGRVRFDAVDFSYRQGSPVLTDVSLTLEPGTVTALVGPSGSGKSTLAALLARFHDVDGGAISIDNVDLRDLSADELYARVGFVFQHTQLIQGTVRENIALAAPDADPASIEQAARAANIHDRIERMPQGYDTLIGATAALSGGERQRLTIARALLADAPVLVLDEATAFADPESEFLVQQALGRLTADRTVLVIAHRLHTVTGADQIVVLDGGRVMESGRHTALIAQEGRYQRLWEAGFAGSTRTEDAR